MANWHQNPTARIIISVLVILLAAFLVYKINHKKEAAVEEQNQIQNQNTPPTQAELSKPKIQAQVWEGVLKSSDDSRRGNLMLQTADGKIYISSSRDFTGLLNKNVTVTYQGALDNFVLGDINEKTN